MIVEIVSNVKERHMAKQVGSGSGILGKVGQRLRAAHEAHKNDETTYSNFGELPPGIEGAIAQVVECKFDVFKNGKNQGEPFFLAAAVVVSPSQHYFGGVTHIIEGLRTQIGPIPVCDTKNARGEVTEMSEYVARIYNELRKLGVDTSKLQVEQLEATAAHIKRIKPFIKFRTWRAKKRDQSDPQYNPRYDAPEAPEPRTNHDWQGVVKFTPSNGSAVQDGTASPTMPAGPKSSAPVKKTGPAKAADPVEPVEPDEGTFTEFGDLASLVERADQEDAEAQNELMRLAAEAGLEAEARSAPDWKAVASLLESGAGTDGPEADEEGPWMTVGEVYAYRPINVRTRKPGDPVEAKVVAIDADAQTVDLVNTRNAKLKYLKVAWDKLESAE